MPDIDPLYLELSKKYGGEKSKYIALIFERMLSADDAKLVLALPVASKEELAEKLGWEPDVVKERVQHLYEKGMLYFTRKGIRPPHSWIEIHDATTSNPKFDEELGENFFELWDKWSLEESAQFVAEAAPLVWKTDPPMRVIAKWKAIKDVPGMEWYDDVRQLIKLQEDTLAIHPCACVRIARKRYPDIPEMICMVVKKTGKWTVDRGSGYKASVKDVLDMLQSIENQPIVHIGYNEKPMNRLISNSPDCCIAFEMSSPEVTLAATAPSRFRSLLDQQMCIGCGECVDLCLFGAIEMKHHQEAGEERAFLDRDKCMGCGNCAVNCCIGAFKMELVEPPEFIPDEFEGYY